jgi:hypothetical protein
LVKNEVGKSGEEQEELDMLPIMMMACFSVITTTRQHTMIRVSVIAVFFPSFLSGVFFFFFTVERLAPNLAVRDISLLVTLGAIKKNIASCVGRTF